MWLFSSERVPESEVMQTQEEAVSYEQTASNSYLDRIDNEFVDHVLSMGIVGTILDLGTGPGQIPIKLAKRDSRISVIGVDLSKEMLKLANERAQREQVSSRVDFILASANSIPVASGSIDLLICNSTLHHFSDPVQVFNEAHRVVKEDGVAYFRDLRRRSRLLHGLHVAFFGRKYKGLMRKSFEDSVRAAYTRPELRQHVANSNLSNARVFYPDLAHIIVKSQKHAV
jgi:ubiquinone/menaquinone biosynthesis C-methylase UbiE